VLAKVRGNKKLLTAMGECSPSGSKISCGVDCDGGGMMAERRAEPGKILMSFGDYYGLRMTMGCGEDEEGDTVMLGRATTTRNSCSVKKAPARPMRSGRPRERDQQKWKPVLRSIAL
jgi:hypothetical protein